MAGLVARLVADEGCILLKRDRSQIRCVKIKLIGKYGSAARFGRWSFELFGQVMLWVQWKSRHPEFPNPQIGLH